MRIVNALGLVLFLIAVLACQGTVSSEGSFMDKVINLSDFNSADNDYNSALGANKYGYLPFLYSSDRGDHSHFNLVSSVMFINYDNSSKQHIITNSPRNGGWNIDPSKVADFAIKTAGSWNILGPNLVSYKYDFVSPCCVDHSDEYALFYADDKEGNLNMKMIQNYGHVNQIDKPIPLDALNSNYDDAYPTFREKYTEVFFCSNRDGNFDIYKATLPSDTLLANRFKDSENIKIEKVKELSSIADDKCPFIIGNMMVFVSNRAGGQGGFDIYYSTYDGQKWSTPTNAGARINTADNEYRPILANQGAVQFNYPLIIFSSDRKGGKGGFDLYMTGLSEDKMEWLASNR